MVTVPGIQTPLLLSLTITILVTVWISWKVIASHRKSLPPGPIGFPFIGSALLVVHEQSWKIFGSWAKTFGAFPGLLHLVSVVNATGR